jgi:hypothetical protein
MIRVVHPGSGFRVKKVPDPGSGSATLVLVKIHGTVQKMFEYF